jgi:hypothetical protein
MLGSFLRRLLRPGRRVPRQRRRRTRLAGCLMWVLLLIILLVVASLLFGGFQKGTKVGTGGAPAPFMVAVLR